MKRLVLVAVLAGLSGPVSSQTVNDDVRCLFLSNAFATGAKEEPARKVAALTRAFYLGRVNARASGSALVAAMRAQGPGVPTAQAAAAMQACAKRAQAAEQQMAAAAQAARPAGAARK